MKGLQNQFREFRRNKPIDGTAGAGHGVKVEFNFKSHTPCGPKAKKPKLEQPIPAGEDSTSFSRHNRLLLSESMKNHPNRAVVLEAMKLSFVMRRNDIVTSRPPIPELLEKYPFLGDMNEVNRLYLMY